MKINFIRYLKETRLLIFLCSGGPDQLFIDTLFIDTLWWVTVLIFLTYKGKNLSRYLLIKNLKEQRCQTYT